jgi:hypothetical protein
MGQPLDCLADIARLPAFQQAAKNMGMQHVMRNNDGPCSYKHKKYLMCLPFVLKRIGTCTFEEKKAQGCLSLGPGKRHPTKTQHAERSITVHLIESDHPH